MNIQQRKGSRLMVSNSAPQDLPDPTPDPHPSTPACNTLGTVLSHRFHKLTTLKQKRPLPISQRLVYALRNEHFSRS